jgi:hypothetical protein
VDFQLRRVLNVRLEDELTVTEEYHFDFLEFEIQAIVHWLPQLLLRPTYPTSVTTLRGSETRSRRYLITASFPLSDAFLANRGTSERVISRITKGRTVLNRIFSKWNSFPVIDRIATCLPSILIIRDMILRDCFTLA